DASTNPAAVRSVSKRRMGETGPQCYQRLLPFPRMTAVKLSICAIASEVVPFAKTGGLADVASALSRELTARGHDVRLFVPFYAQIRRDRVDATKVDSLQNLRIVTGRHEYTVNVWRTVLPGSTTPVYLLESEALYARPALYT